MKGEEDMLDKYIVRKCLKYGVKKKHCKYIINFF